jgi:hypothetical protein
MSPDLVRGVLHWRDRRSARLMRYAGDDVFLSERTHRDAYYHYLLGRRLVWVDDLAAVLDHHTPVKFVVFVEPDQIEAVRDELEHLFCDQIEVARSHEFIIEGNPAGVSKGNALRRLAEHLGIPAADVLAVGDQDNDISMLAWAGVGVAMGNAPDALKAIAAWVAPPLTEDGAAAAIERFVLAGETVGPSQPAGEISQV